MNDGRALDPQGRTTRRDIVLALASAAAACMAPVASAQRANKVWRIGYLGPPAESAPRLLPAFRDGLRELGYVEGHNIAVEYRWTTRAGVLFLDADELLAIARELVALKVEVIAASLLPAILAARQATATIPIVMMNGTDPVEAGLVASLARPGGNVTGVTRLNSELMGKSVELLVEVVPHAKRIAMLANASSAENPLFVGNARQAAQSRGLLLQVVEVRAASELEAAFSAFKSGAADALLVNGDGMFFAQRVRIAEFALAQRLPTMFANTENVEAGGLLSYSSSSVENYRRAASFIDKILRGVPPGEIPVERPTRFELAVNLKTAKAIGAVIPQSLLLRADRIVE